MFVKYGVSKIYTVRIKQWKRFGVVYLVLFFFCERSGVLFSLLPTHFVCVELRKEKILCCFHLTFLFVELRTILSLG